MIVQKREAGSVGAGALTGNQADKVSNGGQDWRKAVAGKPFEEHVRMLEVHGDAKAPSTAGDPPGKKAGDPPGEKSGARTTAKGAGGGKADHVWGSTNSGQGLVHGNTHGTGHVDPSTFELPPPPVRRVVGQMTLKYLAHRGEDGKLRTSNDPVKQLTWQPVKEEPGVVYDDVVEVTIIREQASPDGTGYKLENASGEISMTSAYLVMADIAEKENAFPKGLTGVPYWVVRAMRFNPVFQRVDNAAHSVEIETGRERSGTERALDIVSSVADIVTLGGAGKAGSTAHKVALGAHVLKAGVSLAEDAGLIPSWVSGLVQGVMGLATIQSSAKDFIDRQAAGIVATVSNQFKALKGVEKYAELSKLLLLATETSVKIGQSLGLVSEKDGALITDLAKGQNLIFESLGLAGAIRGINT